MRQARARKVRHTANVGHIFQSGHLAVGDILAASAPAYRDRKAAVVDDTTVRYMGRNMGYNEWIRQATGWKSTCIYRDVMLVHSGELLADLRKKAGDVVF